MSNFAASPGIPDGARSLFRGSRQRTLQPCMLDNLLIVS